MDTSRGLTKTSLVFFISFMIETSLAATSFSNTFPVVVIDDIPIHAASNAVTQLLSPQNTRNVARNDGSYYGIPKIDKNFLNNNKNNLKYPLPIGTKSFTVSPNSKIFIPDTNTPTEIPFIQSENIASPKIKRQYDETDYDGGFYEYTDDTSQYDIDDHIDNPAFAESNRHEKKHEHGGGSEHHEDSHSSHGDKGEKGYKQWHEHEEGKKGHHEHDDHKKYYEEEEGEKKKHEDDEGYYKEYHHGEKGEKGSKFGEKGEYKKGHSTHGKHEVHKKDEYKKNVDFFDEDHSEEGHTKHGDYHHEYEHGHGGKKKKGHYHSEEHEDKYGEKKEHSKGGHHHEEEEHDKSDGEKEHWEHGAKYGKKGGHAHEKKWSHKKKH